MCSAKKDRPEDKKRRRRVVGVLVLVSAVSSVARAFPRRVFRVFVVVALSLSLKNEFSKLRVKNNYLVVVKSPFFVFFHVCLFDLFRSFVVAFFLFWNERKEGTLLIKRDDDFLLWQQVLLVLLFCFIKKHTRDEREREKKRECSERRESFATNTETRTTRR